MSQITRCPSCGTKFKVVADQLRISDGWVRCGQCQEVFDATQSLQPAALAPAESGATDAPEVTGAAPAVPAGYELPAAVEEEGELMVDRALADAVPVDRDPLPEPAAEPEPDVVAAADLEPQPEPEAPLQVDGPTDPILHALPLDDAPLPPPPAAEPGFVRTARRKAFWHRPAVRKLLAASSVVLLLGLAAQVALQERNALAAWQPSLRPALQSLCALAGCTLAARQDIGQVVIVGSAFTRTALDDNYQLSLTIKNQASTALAMPAVELTLTDLQDQAVLRRVLLPAEMQAPATLAAQAEWSARLPLSVTPTATRIAGYRALVFYP